MEVFVSIIRVVQLIQNYCRRKKLIDVSTIKLHRVAMVTCYKCRDEKQRLATLDNSTNMYIDFQSG